jgi:hypothetical protein
LLICNVLTARVSKKSLNSEMANATILAVAREEKRPKTLALEN